jgi:hypothetical protein
MAVQSSREFHRGVAPKIAILSLDHADRRPGYRPPPTSYFGDTGFPGVEDSQSIYPKRVSKDEDDYLVCAFARYIVLHQHASGQLNR